MRRQLRRILSIALALPLAVLLVACQGDTGGRSRADGERSSAAGERSGAARDGSSIGGEAGVPIAEPGFLETLPELGTAPDLRIDGYAAHLVSVFDVQVAQSGTMAVTQWDNRVLRLFDVSGSELGAVGGPAPGPLELDVPGGSGWLGDTLWVNDATLGRIVLYASDRTVLRTLPPLVGARPPEGQEDRYPVFLGLYPYALFQGDTLLVLADLPTRHPRQAQFAQGEHFFRIASDGTIVNPVLDLPANEHVLEVPQEAITTQVPIPFSADPIWGMAPGGSRMVLVTTARNAYRVQVIDSHGDTLAARDLPYDRIPIPREVVDSTVQSRAANASNDRIRAAVLEEMADLVPPVYPPVLSVLVGADQRIWLQIREGPDETAWLVLSPDAEPVGRLSLPVNVWLMAADATHLWGTETDEVGVQSVVRYRLAPGA